MGSGDVSRQQGDDAAAFVDELRQLNARVDRLERELAQLREARTAVAAVPAVAPPPRPAAAAPPIFSAASQIQDNMAEAEAVAVNAVRNEVQKTSLENRLGAQIFNRVGIIALLFAAALGLKLAIDNQWIGPVGRILIGLIAGAGLVLWSERFRRKGFAVFSYSLKAVGSGVLYLSLWAAFQLYHQLPSWAALAGMVLVTAWNAYMAWSQDAELLAAYALVGGLLTPILLSTGGDHEVFLFSYLLAIDVATVLLLRARPWNRLMVAAFPATVLYFTAWYWSHYAEPAFAITTVFLGLFFFVFASFSLGKIEPREEIVPRTKRQKFGHVLREILLPLGNAAFVSLALCAVMQSSDRHWFLPWLMLILAAAYLLMTRLPQSPVSEAVHLSLGIVFLTIAIPLKASGHWITVAWLVEGLALLGAAIRVGAQTESAERSSEVLRWLSAACFVLGLGALIANPFWFGESAHADFFNRHLATSLIGVACFGGAAWLSLRARTADRSLWQPYSRFAFAAMAGAGALAVLLALRELTSLTAPTQPHPAFANADFGMALIGIAVLAGLLTITMRLALQDGSTLMWAQIAAASVIAINLLAILTGVCEIRALWPAVASGTDADLQRSLAVSGFLMLYGAALLAVGFWKRSAFVRWQALVLIVFSIAKTFLYDLRNLSQGYRFVSFLALGALLMAISFAYQKNWLALRGADETHSGAERGSQS